MRRRFAPSRHVGIAIEPDPALVLAQPQLWRHLCRAIVTTLGSALR